LSAAQHARLVGVYELGSDARVHIREEGHGLVAQVAGQTPIPMVPISQNELSFAGSPVTIWFDLPDGDGVATSLELRPGQGEEATSARRIEAR
jgi:hypothetical protein